MKRRDFLKSMSGAVAGSMLPLPAIRSSAKAQSRAETLLIVSAPRTGNDL